MVVINLTLLIQIVLFVVFLLVTNRFFLRPLLRVIDGRKEHLDAEAAQTQADKAEADVLEHEYEHAVLRAKRTIHMDVEARKHQAQEQRLKAVTERLHAVDLEVNTARDQAQAAVAKERVRFGELVPQIVSAIDATLRTGGKTP